MNWSQQLPDPTTCPDCKDLDAEAACPADGIQHAADGFGAATIWSFIRGRSRSVPARGEVDTLDVHHIHASTFGFTTLIGAPAQNAAI